MVENTFQSIRILKLSNLEWETSSLSAFHPDTSPTASLPKGDVTQSQMPSWYLFLICKLTTQIKLSSWSLIHKAWNHHVSNLYQKPADLTFLKQDAHLGCLFAPPFLLQTGTLMSHVFFQRYTARFGKTICVFPCDLLRVLVLTEPQTTQNALEPKFIPLARIPNSPSRATALKFPRHHSVLPKKPWNK